MQNRLLNSLPADDLDLLRPHLERVPLVRGEMVEFPGQGTRYAKFIEEGFVSIVIRVGASEMELGLMGREGMLGVPAALGSETSNYRVIVRQDGSMLRMPAEIFQALMAERRSLGALVLRHIQASVMQLAYTAFANANLTVPQRLARWLLMAHDRMQGDELAISHVALSAVLSVRRPGITVALHELEGEQMIRSRRNSLVILDREKLKAMAGDAYGPAERAYAQLLGPIERQKRAEPERV